MKQSKKSLLAVIGIVAAVLVLWAVVVFSVAFHSNTKSTEDITYYQVLTGEAEGDSTLKMWGQSYDLLSNYELPRLAELKPCLEMRFDHSVMEYSIFTSFSYCLAVSYDAENYGAQKSMLKEKYTYCTEDSPEYSPDILPGCAGELDGFEIRLVEGDMYPKEMLFIATSDARREIVIVYFYDLDLDFVSPSLESFLVENTGWDTVVN